MKVFLLPLVALSFFSLGCSGGDDDDDGPLAHHHFVANGIVVPIDATSSNELAFDVDGDSTPDNQFGSVITALVQASGTALDAQGMVDETILRGDAILLADVQANDLADAGRALFALHEGSAPIPAPCTIQTDLATCGQHLDGTGAFTASGTGADAEGEIDSGTLTAEGGSFVVPVPFLGAIAPVALSNAQVSLSGITTAGFGGTSKIGGAITVSEVDTVLLPALQAWAAPIVLQDCPGVGADCGCLADSTGKTLVDLFDEDASCTITMSDLEASSLLSTLLAPDVDTDDDSVADSLSIGLGITAVAATYTDPN